MGVFEIFTRMKDEVSFDSIEDVEKELEMLTGAMGREDEFIITLDGKPFGEGNFSKDKPTIRKFAKRSNRE